MNDRTDVEISECKNLQLQKSVGLCIRSQQQGHFRTIYLTIIQYDAGRLGPKVFVNCRVQGEI